MAKLPYFPLYTSDFISDTIDLTNEEIGAYIRVLMYSWQKGKVRVDKIVRIIGDVEIWEAISHYFVEENGLWFNPRMEKERSKASDKHEKAVVRAKAGADARWNATSNATSNAQAMLTQNSELRTHNTETQSLELKEILAYFPDSFFHDMTIPNLLLNVSKDHGNDALRAICEKVNTITDPKKRTASYVRGIIKNMDLAGIAKGTVSKQGDKLEWFTRLQCAQMAEKSNNGKTTDEMFRALKDSKGNNIKFQEGDRYEGQPVWVKKG